MDGLIRLGRLELNIQWWNDRIWTRCIGIQYSVDGLIRFRLIGMQYSVVRMIGLGGSDLMFNSGNDWIRLIVIQYSVVE